MNILALDFGMKLGWALSQGKEITGGTVNLHTRSPVKPYYRWVLFKRWLNEIYQSSGGIDLLCYEDVFRHSSRNSSNVYGAFWGFTDEFCGQKQIEMMPVAVPTIKKFWTGSGNAQKALMMKEAKRRGFHPVDDNHADALALLSYVLSNRKKTSRRDEITGSSKRNS